MSQETAVIIGAGPAGLTAAYELLDSTRIHPVVVEMSAALGGLARTVTYRGNRMDLGGHRFFSKSGRVMRWWQNILPLQGAPARDDRLPGRAARAAFDRLMPLRACRGAEVLTGPDPELEDRVMLVRHRRSRILFDGKLYDYPLSLNRTTLANLGPRRLARIAASCLAAALGPIRPERSLEDFFVNRFGRELYRTFFQDYTEKVWGVPCREIPAEWGAQRVKGLSIGKAFAHALRALLPRKHLLEQRETETSLIDRFLYPKYGPGQLWEAVADQVRRAGGEILLEHSAVGVTAEAGRVTGVEVEHAGARRWLPAAYVLSTMPVPELLAGMTPAPPEEVLTVARGLRFRDFLTVGMLLRRLRLPSASAGPVPDQWLYVQQPDVRLGRIQLFNNWSPYLVADPDTVWIGLEYFCSQGDDLWAMPDPAVIRLAAEELMALGFIAPDDLLDATVIRMPRAYPAYFGAYGEFARIREYADRFENLFLIGRNGMHRYNNMDHSMLAAMLAVEQMRAGGGDRNAIWAVNAEEAYHERQ